MRPSVLLKGLFVVLLGALAVTLLSWVTSQHQAARAQGGGGAAAGKWLMVASELRQGEGLVYLFNTDKEVLVIYAYHRGRKRMGRNNFDGDLQFLAGRHCKWDALYCQQLPFPTKPPPKGSHTQKEIEKRYLDLIDGKNKAKKGR